MNQDEIVHISSIVPNLQFLLDEHIQFVHIEIRKNLTRQIANGQPCVLLAIKQAFTFGESDPILPISFNFTVIRRIVCYDEIGQIKKYFPLVTLEVPLNQIFAFV